MSCSHAKNRLRVTGMDKTTHPLKLLSSPTRISTLRMLDQQAETIDALPTILSTLKVKTTFQSRIQGLHLKKFD